MDKKFKILLVSPISEYKDYVLHAWLPYINSLKRSYTSGIVSLDIMLCDNSKNANYHKQLARKFKVDIMHVDPMFMNSREFICESRNRLAEYFLDGPWDRMLSLECDLFPHEHFLTELIAHNKKIVSFPYFIGQGDQSRPMLNVVDHSPEAPVNTRNITDIEMFHYAGKVIPVFNPGLGCTLIKRSVIEKFEFRWVPDNYNHDDSFFAEDVYNANISWYCDFTKFVRHLNQAWNYFPVNKF